MRIGVSAVFRNEDSLERRKSDREKKIILQLLLSVSGPRTESLSEQVGLPAEVLSWQIRVLLSYCT